VATKKRQKIQVKYLANISITWNLCYLQLQARYTSIPRKNKIQLSKSHSSWTKDVQSLFSYCLLSKILV